jgi:hypothetical protein
VTVPVLYFANGVLFAGLSLWFLAVRPGRAGAWWFLGWLFSSFLASILLGISGSVADAELGLAFWRAGNIAIIMGALMLLLFARYFSEEPSPLAFLWAAPALFGTALVALLPANLIGRTGKIFDGSLEQIEWLIFLIIVVFYATTGVIYLAGLYSTLRRSRKGLEQGVAILILAFLLFLISFIASEVAQELGGVEVPLAQAGMLATGLLVLMVLSRFRMLRRGPRSS